MQKSIAYSGPDDTQTVTYEPCVGDTWDENLEIDFEVYLDTACGDQLVITEIRNAETQAPLEVFGDEYAKLERWVRDTYEPTQDL